MLSDGTLLEANTLVDGGRRPEPLVAELGLPLEQDGRIVVCPEPRHAGPIRARASTVFFKRDIAELGSIGARQPAR